MNKKDLYKILLSELYHDKLISKISFIKKTPNGKWVVVSRKGKILGTYKTKTEALKRLRQIEFFKHKKASQDITYSSLIRDISKKYDEDILLQFRKIFKKHFDAALLDGKENPEKIALEASVEFVNKLEDNDDNELNILNAEAYNYLTDAFVKLSEPNTLGNPQAVGEYLSNLIKFILRKIHPDNRNKSINNLKNKIYLLDEHSLARKKMPAAASIGQSLVIIKHLLFGKDPNYIRAVLNSIAQNL